MAQERGKQGGGKETKGEATKGELDLEALFNSVEGRVRDFLTASEKWIGQGDELLGKAKTWVEEHPVATALAAKYGRKVSFVPRSGDEFRETAARARRRARGGASRAYAVARENPFELAVVGVALGAAAWAVMRAARA